MPRPHPAAPSAAHRPEALPRPHPARPVWMHGVGAPHAAFADRRYREDRRRARHGLAPTCDRDGVGARHCLARSQSCQPGGSMGQPTAPARPVWMHGVGAPHAASADRRYREDRRRARRGVCAVEIRGCKFALISTICPSFSLNMTGYSPQRRGKWWSDIEFPLSRLSTAQTPCLAPTCDRDGVGARPCLARSQSCQPGGSMGQPTAPARPVWMHGVGAPHAASANQRRREDRRRARHGLAPTSGRT